MKALSTEIKDAVIVNIRRDMASFGIDEIELRQRITVKLDTDQFNYKEDESVWLQKREKAPFVCEVYFDDCWCCDLHQTDSHHKLIEKFFKGFEKGYDSGKIRLNRFLAEIQDAQETKDKKDAEKKALDSLPSSTPEEKIAKEIVTEIVQEKNADPHSTATT